MLPVIGVLAAFLLIVVLRLRNMDFSISILAGALVVGITSTAPVEVFSSAVMDTLQDPVTLSLSMAVALISVLGYSLKETNLISGLIEGLRTILPGQALLAMIPALFGLLSMPGGALMSAPFNDPVADRLRLSPEQKTYMNVWFRHLWYWASPISPTPLLAASLAGITLNHFLSAQLPLFIVTVTMGFVVSSRFIRGGTSGVLRLKGVKNVTDGLLPIFVTVALSVVGVPVWASLSCGIALVFIIGKVPSSRMLGLVHGGIRWDIVASVVSMLFFRSVVLASGSVVALFNSVTRFGIPLIVILIIVPLLIGAISGTPTMGIGMAFPLLLPLCGNAGVHVVSVVYTGIICGYLASPMHLCLILTNKYYKSELGRVYRYLVPSVIILYIVSVAYHLLTNGSSLA
jgi:integral membrane protein (TIGR00529 family)